MHYKIFNFSLAEKRLNDEQKFVSIIIFQSSCENCISKYYIFNIKLYKFRRQGQAEAKVLSEEEIRKRRKEKRVSFT